MSDNNEHIELTRVTTKALLAALRGAFSVGPPRAAPRKFASFAHSHRTMKEMQLTEDMAPLGRKWPHGYQRSDFWKLGPDEAPEAEA